ncbi:MAG: TonB-dependent receptor [Candidatus Solibacter usitatus]|nr:TonB-dependent receptor [Candidatus Solibacter usitatus]
MKHLSVYLALLMCAFPTYTQNLLGVILGTVSDSAGRPVATRVELTNTATGRMRSAASGPSGGFVISQLPAGEYLLEAAASGQPKYSRKITLLVNQELRADIAMGGASKTESIDVIGVREMLKTETASMGAVIENRQVAGLPLDGRNFYELSLLAPGTAPSAQGSAGSTRGDFSIHVNGSREDANLFLLDGVYNSDPKLNGIASGPPVDGVREFEILTSSYDASFGRNAGAQVSVVTKSGGNNLHGTAYEFFRNGAMDESNYFAPAGESSPRYQRNQFGYSLGGPIVRNRTFLFSDYEGRRGNEGVTLLTRVPSQLERRGDFSQSFDKPLDPFTRQPFPGGRIPQQFQHPIGVGLANFYPLANRNNPAQNFVSSPIQRDSANQMDMRVDHALRNSNLTVRYSMTDRSQFAPFAGPQFAQIPGFGNAVPSRAQNLMAGETRSFTPTVLNELRLAFSRVSSGASPEITGNNVNRAFGIPQVSTLARDNGLTFITTTGFSPLGHEYNSPLHGASNTSQLLDPVTLTRGNGQHLRGWSFDGFVNDQVRVTRNLTLNIGLRYEFNKPPVDAANHASLFDPVSRNLVPVGTAGVPNAGYFADKNNFAPRFGLAWMPGGGKTVLRGGYGFYYDLASLAPSEGLYFNLPYYDLRFYLPSQTSLLFIQDPFPAKGAVPSGPSAFGFQRNLRTPYVQQWNFNVQRALGGSRVVELGYVGSKGTKLQSARDANQPKPSTAQYNLRPMPQYSDVTFLESRSNSIYHSLQARLQQRFTHGLSGLVSYTFGKSIDDASGFFASTGDANFPQDSNNVRLERARSSFDVRQRMSIGYSYDLPFGKGRLRGGWQTHGIMTFQSGRPFTVALPQEEDNSNTGFSNLGFGSNDRPNVIGNPNQGGASPGRWFNTAAFAKPAFGTFGNAGRNILQGPGLATVNFSVVKDTAITERATVQFRAELFNLFDRANFDLPNLYFGTPAFGSVQSAQGPRRGQFGLKFIF